MFKHILIPTDGTALSQSAVNRGFRLAAELHAKVTVLHVLPEHGRTAFQVEMLDDTHDQFMLRTKARAEEIFEGVRKEAKRVGVACDTEHAIDNRPYAAIVRIAAKRSCDLILMASHGAQGLEGLLLGSETQKVLVHSNLPVLVYR